MINQALLKKLISYFSTLEKDNERESAEGRDVAVRWKKILTICRGFDEQEIHTHLTWLKNKKYFRTIERRELHTSQIRHMILNAGQELKIYVNSDYEKMRGFMKEHTVLKFAELTERKMVINESVKIPLKPYEWQYMNYIWLKRGESRGKNIKIPTEAILVSEMLVSKDVRGGTERSVEVALKSVRHKIKQEGYDKNIKISIRKIPVMRIYFSVHYS